MDSRVFLAFCICFLSLVPDLAHSATDKQTQGSVLRLTTGVSSAPFDPTRVTQISWRPRAFLYKGLLSDEECDHLIHLAKDKLEKSMVADNNSGKSIESEVRTSSGMFLRKAQDEVVASLEARIAAWTFLPEDNGEAIQILHYEHGQKYEPHFDYFYDKINQELGGHRVATVLMYLSDVKRGGETVFPNSEAKDTQPKDGDWSDCAKNGYAVKPNKGDALLFFSLHPNATTDPLSLHGSCPVIEGEKWSATKWIHVRSFEKAARKANGDCSDENENCALWAAAGECERNPNFMVGSKNMGGFCRKSCKRGLWTPEEDAKILAYVASNGVGNWTLVPQKAGLNRCGKSCRLRWTNYLRPDLKHDSFTPEEEQLILDCHQAIGSRWSLIAKQLLGRTDNDVKNHWNTKLKKKLSKMGIDPVTHKPFSQILSDYGKISSLTNTRNPIPSLNVSTNNMQVSLSGLSFLPMESSISQPFPQQFQDQSFPEQPNFFPEISPSASSSSSCSFPQLSPQSFPYRPPQAPVITPSSPPSWSTEFLVRDMIPSADMEIFSSSFPPKLTEVGQERACEAGHNGGQKKHVSEAASSSASSFVEAILDKDSEMQMEFPLKTGTINNPTKQFKRRLLSLGWFSSAGIFSILAKTQPGYRSSQLKTPVGGT